MVKAKAEKAVHKKTGEVKIKKVLVKPAAEKKAASKAGLVKKATAVRAKKTEHIMSKAKPVIKKEVKHEHAVEHVSHEVSPHKINTEVLKHKPVEPKVILKPVEEKIVSKQVPQKVTQKIVEQKATLKPAATTEQKPKVEEAVQLKPKVAEVPKEVPATVLSKPEQEMKELELELPVTVKDLSIKLQEKPSTIIKTLMDMRVMSGINQGLDEQVVAKLGEKYHFKIKKAPDKEELILRVHQKEDDVKLLLPRAPIVTFMGHVDHGKTSLLDAIRKTKVVDSEHGGITQHIGAYRVKLEHGEITFLDTPGHEAFTAMRARGASVTDLVVLVVAADDGIMPQTEEAIDHARAAGVPIIIALNKIDKPQANPDIVKKQLGKFDLAPEDWGGKTIVVPVSAKTGVGIDNLLEMILLEAQMLELKANPHRLAHGVVIEAKMSKGRGPVATLLVQNGTLHLNENIIVGKLFGKIRAMFNDRAQAVTSAGPGHPVEVLGISEVPVAGEQFFVISDDKEAKEIAQIRAEKERQRDMKVVKRVNLEELHAQIQEGKIKELKIIIKADVQGSLEAIKETLRKLNVSEIKIDIIHTGVGSINTSDVVLAMASNALILGFNVSMDSLAREQVSKEGVDVKTYNIIYELANDIKAAVEGMLEPKFKKIFIGRAEVRKVFKLTKAGAVAGCIVVKGKINRNNTVSVVRNGDVIHEDKLSSLKHLKDDVREVSDGFECGIVVGGFVDYQVGDLIEAYDLERIARKL
ncbi:MAG: translation initiation factor IF-2 [Candidatus Omnitrophica bacterium]|nr:translation initiation factor IF-2 [Candidatus Omnitrophota bacterium]